MAGLPAAGRSSIRRTRPSTTAARPPSTAGSPVSWIPPPTSRSGTATQPSPSTVTSTCAVASTSASSSRPLISSLLTVARTGGAGAAASPVASPARFSASSSESGRVTVPATGEASPAVEEPTSARAAAGRRRTTGRRRTRRLRDMVGSLRLGDEPQRGEDVEPFGAGGRDHQRSDQRQRLQRVDEPRVALEDDRERRDGDAGGDEPCDRLPRAARQQAPGVSAEERRGDRERERPGRVEVDVGGEVRDQDEEERVAGGEEVALDEARRASVVDAERDEAGEEEEEAGPAPRGEGREDGVEGALRREDHADRDPRLERVEAPPEPRDVARPLDGGRRDHAVGVVEVLPAVDVDGELDVSGRGARIHRVGEGVEAAPLEGHPEVELLGRLQPPRPEELVAPLPQLHRRFGAVHGEGEVGQQDLVLLQADREDEDHVHVAVERVLRRVIAGEAEVEAGEVDEAALAVVHRGVDRDRLPGEGQRLQRVEDDAGRDVSDGGHRLVDGGAPPLHHVAVQVAVGEAAPVGDPHDQDGGDPQHDREAPPEVEPYRLKDEQTQVPEHATPPGRPLRFWAATGGTLPGVRRGTRAGPSRAGGEVVQDRCSPAWAPPRPSLRGPGEVPIERD